MAPETAGKFALLSKRVATPLGLKHAAVIVENEVIKSLCEPAKIPHGVSIEDLGNSVIMPGVIDAHVHINEPGRTEWEGFETATAAAAAGGVTTLVDMPLNSSPPVTSTTNLQAKLSAAQGKARVNCGFYAGVVPGNSGEIPALARAGVLGFKVFMVHSGIDEFPSVSEQDLREALPLIAATGRPLLVHAEIDLPECEALRAELSRTPKSYMAWLASRPPRMERDAIALMIKLCREFNCRVHIVHLATEEALPLIRDARKEGLPISVETCPHYLYFCAENVKDGNTLFKCAPPIRSRRTREELWGAFRGGVIDFIASDHSPSETKLKCLEEGSFQKAWGGIAGIQFMLPAVWSAATRRNFRLEQIVEWLCHGPACFLGLERKGRLAPGCDADITVWNPERNFTVEASKIEFRHKISPYCAEVLSGEVERTYVRGKIVFENGRLSPGVCGELLLHN